MKTPYKQSDLIKIKNINNSYKNRYKIRYSFFGIKYTIKNKEKIEFYKTQKEQKNLKKYNEIQNVLDGLKEKRAGKKSVLTILVPTYNHYTTIEKCIQSLINQNTKYDYIIKILDDASTDGTTDICFEYAQKYPEKIEYILQPINTRVKHFRPAIKSLDTDYWCFVDGDDWWLKDDVIENAVSFLEEHKEYSVYAANSIYISPQGKEKDYVHEILNHKEVDSYITLDNYFLPHPAGRIHRRVIDYAKEFPDMRYADVYLFITSLTRGACYFKDEYTNVRNNTGVGVFTKYNAYQISYCIRKYLYAINTWLDFKYDKEITKIVNNNKLNKFKKFFGMRLGWVLFLIYSKYNFLYKNTKNVLKTYNEIDRNQQTKKR